MFNIIVPENLEAIQQNTEGQSKKVTLRFQDYLVSTLLQDSRYFGQNYNQLKAAQIIKQTAMTLEPQDTFTVDRDIHSALVQSILNPTESYQLNRHGAYLAYMDAIVMATETPVVEGEYGCRRIPYIADSPDVFAAEIENVVDKAPEQA